MRAILIYNPHDVRETSLLERAKQEMLNCIEDVEVVDFMEVKDIYKIQQTPALILIREDMQGLNLLEEDTDKSQLRFIGEISKSLQEEEQNIHENNVNRIDGIIQAEVNKKMGENTQVMEDMASLLQESGVI